MQMTTALHRNFLGHAPSWYKSAIIAFLVINPVALYTVGPFVTGWLLILEFIFTLAMALKCYPLQAGGLLAIEAIALGMATPYGVLHEVQNNLEVILLLVFMVAGIYFMKDLLLLIFTKLLLSVHSKPLLSLLFCLFSAFLSAFLDALTVAAVVISVAVGFYSIYHKVASGKKITHASHDHSNDGEVIEFHREDLDGFRAFLRSLLMHAAIGTALGGVCTIVGEPQNLVIGSYADWSFIEFFIRMSPVSIPVLVMGLLTCVALEKVKWFGYGAPLPDAVREVLEESAAEDDRKRTNQQRAALMVQGAVAIWLIVGLAFHLAAVGLIGLSVIVLITAFNGIIEEHSLGKAFEEALPFTALLVVFFSIVAVIETQHLFKPVIDSVLQMEGHDQIGMFYLANGLLSAISDNVFVGTVYIKEVSNALSDGVISRDQFDMLAVAINTGTNIPSVATPNGQAAFLFLLTSAIAPLIRLSYGRMVIMALPYTLTMAITGYLMVMVALEPMTESYYENGLIQHHSAAQLSGEKSNGHDGQH